MAGAKDGFKFELGQIVTVAVSGEKGNVIGRAEYLHDENRYLVRYKAADGKAAEEWWNQSALV